MGELILETPERWLPEQADAVDKAVTGLAHEVIESINFYVKSEAREALERGSDFDPKILFKSQKGVDAVEREVLRDSRRHAERDIDCLFKVKAVR